jgi:hypothetical protein
VSSEQGNHGEKRWLTVIYARKAQEPVRAYGVIQNGAHRQAANPNVVHMAAAAHKEEQCLLVSSIYMKIYSACYITIGTIVKEQAGVKYIW